MTSIQEAPVMTTTALTGERADILETLTVHRYFLRHTVQGLTDDQARERTTASELTLGGLIKHVADTEEKWARGPTSWCAACPTWTSPTRCPRRRGSSQAHGGRPAGCSCTSSPRPPST